MGPRSADRGNDATVPVAAGDTLLQWGRDQLIAEMDYDFELHYISAMLQWGRDQLIAEIRLAKVFIVKCHVASMGPRSADRGNTHTIARASRQLPRFNGAAIS